MILNYILQTIPIIYIRSDRSALYTHISYIIYGTCIHCCYVYTCCSLDKSLPCRISPRFNEGVCFLWTRFRADLATRSLARYHENLRMPSPMPPTIWNKALKRPCFLRRVGIGGDTLRFRLPWLYWTWRFNSWANNNENQQPRCNFSSALGKSGNVFEKLGLCSSSKRTIGFISEVHRVDLSPPKKCASP